jgi:hypothetical protein
MLWWILAVLLPGAIVVGFRRHRHFGLVVAAMVATLWAAWLGVFTAIKTDYRDADGMVDCWPSCSAFQDIVGIVYFAAPVALAVVLLCAVAVWLSRRRRQGGAGVRRLHRSSPGKS